MTDECQLPVSRHLERPGLAPSGREGVQANWWDVLGSVLEAWRLLKLQGFRILASFPAHLQRVRDHFWFVM